MRNITHKVMKNANKSENNWLIFISVITLIGMYFGWKLFWFLTDDAFIAFRYVSNSQLGYGYVWNPPPFLPVEGYTSFLWVLLLDLVWRITGIEPPDAANWISLLFAYLSLLVVSAMVLKMKLVPNLRRGRILLLGLVLLGTISNRTFLAWSSSGLETAMFNFFFTLWIYVVLFLPFGSGKWFWGMSSTAVFLYLTRPDGLLMAAATIVLTLFTFAYKKGQFSAKDFVPLAPFLLIPAHLLWRFATYGEWLPNTYYAKSDTGRVLFGSGLKYVLSFILEYALWVWLLILGVLIVYVIFRRRPKSTRDINHQFLAKASMAAPAVMVSLTVPVHLGYYTILVGGDHFEFRVYSHLVPLIFVSFIWMLNTLQVKAKGVALLLILFILLSWPIPWIHWTASQAYTTRAETNFLKVSVAEALQKRLPNLPDPLVSYLQFYDDLQFSLIDKLTAVRHQEHKIFYDYLTKTHPVRAETTAKTTPDHPLMVVGSTGFISWVYPHVNFIDAFGLNDYVIARNPSLRASEFMAHERKPPPGYVYCFAPGARQDEIVYVTAETIIKCEQIFREWTRSPELAPALIRARTEPMFVLNTQFGDYFLLQGYDFEVQTEKIILTLHWESLQKSDFDYSVFVHLINERGERIWQEDYSPGSEHGYPPTKWEPGEQILDLYTLEYSANLEQVSINVGVYNWQTGERLATSPAGKYPGDFVQINKISMIVGE